MDGTGRLGRLLITFQLCEAASSSSQSFISASISRLTGSGTTNSSRASARPAIGIAGFCFSLKALSKPLRRQLTPPANFWTCSRRTGEPHRHSAGLQHRPT
ncbi:hypothetical protein [Bradyrhizobium sp. 155]|uniref:hypothetical protein n=1 Tax=Bradyrhizobium sp. 155 TaxID=2782629 RepID=UPI001FFFB4EC|nr:hypothetical protein [Bradyrhizobium sp. 155]